MADEKISELDALTEIASTDEFVVVDKSDTTDASSGTTKKITYSNLNIPVKATGTTVNTGTADDEFVTRYMADIGHYEFGNLHRPIQFLQLDAILSDMTPNSLDYWIAYWIAAFEHLSKQDGIAFLSYENLCQSPENGLGKLCQHIELYVPQEAIAAAATIFRSPPDARIQQHNANAELMNHAEQIHHNLLSRCLLNQ